MWLVSKLANAIGICTYKVFLNADILLKNIKRCVSLQNILSLRIGKNNFHVLFTIGKFIKTNYIAGGGVGFKVMLKPCPRGQTFTAMIGYCTKDRNNSYFRMVSKGVSLAVSIFLIFINSQFNAP